MGAIHHGIFSTYFSFDPIIGNEKVYACIARVSLLISFGIVRHVKTKARVQSVCIGSLFSATVTLSNMIKVLYISLEKLDHL